MSMPQKKETGATEHFILHAQETCADTRPLCPTDNISTSTRTGVSLLSLPWEVIRHILLYIPIDSRLREVALSSRLFGEHLMYDPHFAYIHTQACSNKEEGGFAAYKARVTPQLYKMPYIYLQGTLRYILEEQYDKRDVQYPRGPLKGFFMTESACGKIVSGLSSVLSKVALPRLFHCLRTFRNSGDAAAAFLKHHPDICSSRYDLIEAVEKGWKEFVRISVRQGFDVSQHRCHVLEAAIKREDVEMIAILLEDNRVNLTADDYRLLIKLLSHEKTKVTKRLVQVVETLLSDKRVANGEFLKAVLHGDVDSVTIFLANPESDPAVLGNLSVKLAIYFTRPDVLEKLLQDMRIFPYSLKDSFLFSKAVGKKEYWSVYQILLKNARMHALSEDCWIEVICEHNNLEAVFALISHGQLKSSVESNLWRNLLQAACNHGAYTIVAYILDMEDPEIDINAVDFDESFFQSVEEKHARILALFGADKRFQPFDTWNIDGFIDSASGFATSPFVKLIRTDSRFFLPRFLKRLAERAFIARDTDYMRTLLSCPCIQSDLFSQPRIAEFFNLDPDMSTAELMISICRLQILHEAIYLEDDELLAEMLQSNVPSLFHLEELLGCAHSVKSWTILLRCILSIESRDPSTKYYLLLMSVLESPNEPISFENLANLLQWTSRQRLFSVRSYLLFGQVQRICESRERFYAAWDAFAAVEVLRSDNPRIMILDGYYS
ncbi:hypothetical protein BJ741DRAFT_620886 [Chytriomyces cf. hyalinus JEL632]|nr:hypothetical protein BJ741DRAFT_620886 [Chytriomyces cf. hyalinus JEL632]